MSYRNPHTGQFCTLSDAISDTFDNDAPSALVEHVATWLLDRAADSYDGDLSGVLRDLMYGGCAAGTVGHLCYYSDTTSFYLEHRAEIQRLVATMLDGMGVDGCGGLFGDRWDTSDPFAHDTMNQNLLAWFGFEETARSLAYAAGVDV